MTSRLAVLALTALIACSGSDAARTTTNLDTARPQVLIASELGVFLADSDNVAQIFDSSVLLAMDDGRGGIIFQKGRVGADDWDSTIWWLSPGSTEAEALVTPANGHILYLSDVALGPAGTEVWYTRTEGSTIQDTVQHLLRHSFATGASDNLGEIGHSASSVRISVGGNLVVGEWGADGLFRCGFHDREFAEIGSAASPCQEEPFDYGCQACPRHLEVSTDGEKVAWLEARSADGVSPTTLVVRDSTSGSEIAEIPLPVDRGDVISVDFEQGWLLLNLVGPNGAWVPAILVDLEGGGGIVELPVIGTARFVRSAVEINAE